VKIWQPRRSGGEVMCEAAKFLLPGKQKIAHRTIFKFFILIYADNQ